MLFFHKSTGLYVSKYGIRPAGFVEKMLFFSHQSTSLYVSKYGIRPAGLVEKMLFSPTNPLVYMSQTKAWCVLGIGKLLGRKIVEVV